MNKDMEQRIVEAMKAEWDECMAEIVEMTGASLDMLMQQSSLHDAWKCAVEQMKKDWEIP